MSKRRHTKAPEGLLSGDTYLSENITIHDKDRSRIYCKLCKNDLYYENLTQHMQSIHLNTKKLDKDQESITRAINYLESQKRQSRTSKSPSQNQNKSDMSAEEEKSSSKKVLRKTKSKEEEIKSNEMADESDLGSGVLELIEELPNANSEQERLNRQKKFRFYITSFLLANNLPFSLGSRLTEFIKALLNEFSRQELGFFTASDKHISSIAIDCIARSLKEKYQNVLTTSPYSISLDAGTALNNTEYVGINIRFLQFLDQPSDIQYPMKIIPTTKTIALTKVGVSATGEAFFKMLEQTIFSKGDLSQIKANFMGIATDHASNMISNGVNSLTSRIKDSPGLSHLVVVHDLPHALNLILKHSIKEFDDTSVPFIEKVTSHIVRSPQRSARLKDLIKASFGESSVATSLLKFVPTRWSSLSDCTRRVIKFWPCIEEFYREEAKLKGKEEINKSKLTESFNPKVLQSLKLLLNLVEKVNSYIVLFQKEDIPIARVAEHLKTFAVQLGSFIFKGLDKDFSNDSIKEKAFNELLPYLSDLKKYEKEEDDPHKQKKRSIEEFQIYLDEQESGLKAEVSKLPQEDQREYYEKAFKFMSSVIYQMKTRISWRDSSTLELSPILQCQSFLLPKHMEFKDVKTNIQRLAKHFSNVISSLELTEIDIELHQLANHVEEIRKKIKIVGKESYLQVWHTEKSRYPLLYKLVCAVEAIQYSTSSIERLFSDLGNIVTVKRNRLSVENIEACLLARQESKKTSKALDPQMFNSYLGLIVDTGDDGDVQTSNKRGRSSPLRLLNYESKKIKETA